MAPKKNNEKKAVKSKLPDLSVGTPVILKRSHLWSSASGVVEKVTDGKHLIKIPSKHGGFWHAEATADFLEIDI